MSRTKDGQPRLVVGVGASADGLAAFKELLSAVPEGSGMAFLLVQHLLPEEEESSLRELLAPCTGLAVVAAEDGLALRADTVYVIRPGTLLGVRSGALEVTAPPAARPLPRPVDHLFQSLARESGPQAVGVVLSGAGSDGSAGLRAIKSAGGLTISQEPAEGEQRGMPQSALDTGIVDLVLPVRAVPRALARFASLPPEVRALPDPAQGEPGSEPSEGLSERDMGRLTELFDSRHELDLRAYKRATVERRTRRRMALSGFSDASAYLERLADDPGELEVLARDLLISVTDFFRDPSSFRVLREKVIEPAIAESAAGRTFRVWVPGCATGEEAYSIGMEVLDAAAAQEKAISVQIFATDIDEEALAVARTGIYPASIAERVSEPRLHRYFRRLDEARYQVKKNLRYVISFAPHDLTKDPPFSRMDLVSCRNMLIYLAPPAQQHVLKVLHFALKPEGYLLLGASETASPQRDLFSPVSKCWRIYKKVGTSGPVTVRGSRYRLSYDREGGTPNPQPALRQPARSRRGSGDELAQRAILRAWVPPTVVVADDDTLLFMHGELGPYLRFPQGGAPRLELSALLRPEIATRTRGALYRARRAGEEVVARWIAGPPRGEQVRITVRPAADLGEGAVILSFERVGDASRAQSPADESLARQLEQELQATRDDLYHTVAELEAANEELRSSNEESVSMNEELQSANEELEATTEELRSLNEELTMANAQLREKVQEVEQAHDDLDNFFASTKVATLFLDERLCVKRFTSAAAELVGLGERDVGRFIGDIAREPLHSGLEEEVHGVLQHLAPRVRELRTQEGRWISRQVLPFRTGSDRIEGAVVTFLDVTELKSATERLALRERQQAVVARIGLQALKEADLQAFLDQAVREVQQTLESDYCELLELQPGGETLLLRAGVGWTGGLVGAAQVGTGADSQAGYTLRAPEPVIVDDLARDRRFSGPALLAERGVVSGLSCVVRAGEHVYGVLGAHTRTRRAFTAEDAYFLQAVATVIGSAIASRQSRIRLAVERGVAHALAEPLPLEDAFGQVLDTLIAELGASVAELWWPGEGGARLARRQSRIAGTGDRGEIETRFALPSLPVGEGPIGRVYDEGRAIWCTDLADDASFIRREGADALGLVTALVFPVVSGRDALGVVAVFSRERLAVDDVFLRSLEGVGRLIGDLAVRSEVEARAGQLAAITESSHDAILSYDLSGRITQWLPGAERLFGYRAEEMVGDSIERIVPEDRREELWSIGARLRAGEVVEPFETARVRRDGQVLEVSVRSSPVRDHRGKVVGISSADRDVSRQKDAERKLVAADRQKDDFLAMLGHELRNPLAAIRSVAELLKMARSGGPRLERVQAVLERQTVHMGKLLDGLLDVSRIMRGRIELEWEDIDLAAVCRDVVADASESTSGRNLAIQTELPDGPVWARADRVRIAQIVDNLLSNAIKYTADGGTIRVSLRPEGGSGVLVVRDTGAGIEPELLPHIFDVFRQAQQGLDRAYGGLGVGLALVRSLAELHGGSVEAHSEGKGRGAEFVVRLPIVRVRMRAPASRGGQAPDHLQILLIEDNEDAAEMLRQVLELIGHEVAVATRGREGVDRARALRPDLVLCDLGLPGGMTGFDVAREIRADPALEDVWLVAVSGYGRPGDKARGAEMGFDAHMTKPVDVETLQRVIAGLTGPQGEAGASPV